MHSSDHISESELSVYHAMLSNVLLQIGCNTQLETAWHEFTPFYTSSDFLGWIPSLSLTPRDYYPQPLNCSFCPELHQQLEVIEADMFPTLTTVHRGVGSPDFDNPQVSLLLDYRALNVTQLQEALQSLR